jgi:hypothetical protein
MTDRCLRKFSGSVNQQCRNYERNPDAMRPRILRTIEAIEGEWK